MKHIKFSVGAVLVMALAAPAAALASPVKVPIGTTARPAYSKVKPAIVGLTNDSSEFYGGRTGHPTTGGREHHYRENFGHLRWVQYRSYMAEAKGVDWAKYYANSGPLATQPFHIQGVVDLTWNRPRNGVFTRLTVTERYTHNYYTKRLRGKTRTWSYNYPRG